MASIAVTEVKLGRLAQALRRAAEARGRPCKVTTQEILKEFSAPGELNSNDVGRCGRSTLSRFDLLRALGGREVWGAMPMYERGVWWLP